MIKREPYIDIVIGPQSYHKLPEMIDDTSININDKFLQNEKFKNLLFMSLSCQFHILNWLGYLRALIY